MTKKIEIDILAFILIEAIFLLFFFKESLLTIILGIVLGIILIFVTKKIKQNNFSKMILLIITCFLCPITFYYIITFIHDNILKNSSLFIIIFSFLLLSFYFVHKNYHAFIKAVEISFYIFIFFKITSFILIIPKINIHYFKLNNEITYNYHFIIIGLIILYFYKVIYYLSNYKLNKKRTMITLINPLFIRLITTLVLGNTLLKLYQYPYLNYLKLIRYFDFVERVDGILSFEYFISFFYLFTFLLLIIKTFSQSLISGFRTIKCL